MAAWIAFNSFLCKKYPGISGDRDKVRAFGNDHDYLTSHERKLKDVPYRRSVEILQDKGVKDMQQGSDRIFRIDNIVCFAEVMECVYQVRCNLFHGDKTVDEERDNNLVRAANTIVLSHLDFVLNEFRNSSSNLC